MSHNVITAHPESPEISGDLAHVINAHGPGLSGRVRLAIARRPERAQELVVRHLGPAPSWLAETRAAFGGIGA